MSATWVIVLSSVLVLSAAAIFSFLIGRRGERREDWIVGGRSLPIYVVAGSQFATGMGGGVLVAHIGIGYSAGWSAITYNLLYSIGIVILVLLANWLKEQNFSTMPEIFKKLYGNNKVMISIVTFFFFIVIFSLLCFFLISFFTLF